MRKQLAIYGLGLALAAAVVPVAAQQAIATDAVVARVGGEGITRADLVRQLFTYFGRAGLEMLTDRSILDQEASLRKLEVSDADVEARVSAARKAGGADLDKALKEGAITEDAMRTQARYAVLMEKLLDSKWPVKDSDLVRLSVRFARTLSQQQGRGIIAEAKRGVDFALLAKREGIEGGGDDGFAMPNPFLRVQNPPMYRLASQANLRVGQVTPQPLQSGKYWMVLKLEKVFGAETLTGKTREAAIQMVRASRAPGLMPTSRKRYPVTTTTQMSELIAKADLAPDTELVKVGATPITRKELLAYLFEAAGKGALDQLIERKIVAQQAAKSGVTVSDAEVDGRVATVKKQTGEASFQSALVTEGITEDAWKERVRFTYLAEKLVNQRMPVKPDELERYTVKYVRVASKPEAEEVIKLALSGAKFEQLQQQKSLDKAGDGFLRPKIFMRSENPEAYKVIEKARLQAGQVLPQPVEAGSFFLVLKLEGRFGADLMSAKERDDAIRRINALRMTQVLDQWHSEAKVDYPIPLKTLIADARR